jgi:hypothetical protein
LFELHGLIIQKYSLHTYKTISRRFPSRICKTHPYAAGERRNPRRKKVPLPAADAHPFAHRPRQLARAAERKVGARQSNEQRGEGAAV